jgi:hypothetical protein
MNLLVCFSVLERQLVLGPTSVPDGSRRQINDPYALCMTNDHMHAGTSM